MHRVKLEDLDEIFINNKLDKNKKESV